MSRPDYRIPLALLLLLPWAMISLVSGQSAPVVHAISSACNISSTLSSQPGDCHIRGVLRGGGRVSYWFVIPPSFTFDAIFMLRPIKGDADL